MPVPKDSQPDHGPTSLDAIDFQILNALQLDARLSNKELASAVGLAPSSCLERVRRLRVRGVLRGFHADVDPAALGIGLQAMMAIRLTQHTRENFEAFLTYTAALREVLAVYQVAGKDDFLVHVAIRDTDHLRDFVMDQISTRPEVAHLETALMYDHVRNPTLPQYS